MQRNAAFLFVLDPLYKIRKKNLLKGARGALGDPLRLYTHDIYHLVMTNIVMENHHAINR